MLYLWSIVALTTNETHNWIPQGFSMILMIMVNLGEFLLLMKSRAILTQQFIHSLNADITNLQA